MPEPATHHVTKMALRSRTRHASAHAYGRMLDVNAPMTIALSVCGSAEYPCAKLPEMDCAARLHLRKAALHEHPHDERGFLSQLRETGLLKLLKFLNLLKLLELLKLLTFKAFEAFKACKAFVAVKAFETLQALKTFRSFWNP